MSGPRIAWVDARDGLRPAALLGACRGAGAVPEAVGGVPQISGSPHIASAPLPSGVPRIPGPAESSGGRDPRAMLAAADLPAAVRDQCVAVLDTLARAGADPPSAQTLAETVSVVAAVHSLGIDTLRCGAIGLADDTPTSILRMLRGTGATARGGLQPGATSPPGVALALVLADEHGPLPPLHVDAVGESTVATSTSRIVVGRAPTPHAAEPIMLLQANVDDLDPRLWPSTLAALLHAGAADAWLTPILMKKGRPAHTLAALVHPTGADAVRRIIFTHTTTIGVREQELGLHALARQTSTIHVAGHRVRVKLAQLDGVTVNAMPEYEDIAAAAAATGLSPKAVLAAAHAALHQHTPPDQF